MNAWWLLAAIPLSVLIFLVGARVGFLAARGDAYERISKVKFEEWLPKYLEVNDYKLVTAELASGLTSGCCSSPTAEVSTRDHE